MQKIVNILDQSQWRPATLPTQDIHINIGTHRKGKEQKQGKRERQKEQDNLEEKERMYKHTKSMMASQGQIKLNRKINWNIN